MCPFLKSCVCCAWPRELVEPLRGTRSFAWDFLGTLYVLCIIFWCGSVVSSVAAVYSLATTWCMHCSLARWCEADPQHGCILVHPICCRIPIRVFAFLSTVEGHRVSVSCFLLFVDRNGLFLLVTELRLGLVLSSFSVATPPVAPWPPLPRPWSLSSGNSSEFSSEAD